MFREFFKEQKRKEWKDKFEGFTSENLQEKGVLKREGYECLFVDFKHPVVHLMRINKDVIGVDIDDQFRIDGVWIKMTRRLFESGCLAIRERIINELGYE